MRSRGSQRILNQPDAAVLRVCHVKQRAVWRKVQTERAMKAAGYPARARPPCAAHGKRVACRGADDADLVVACVRDRWKAAARVQRQRARQRGGAPVLPRWEQRRGRGRERAPGARRLCVDLFASNCP